MTEEAAARFRSLRRAVSVASFASYLRVKTLWLPSRILQVLFFSQSSAPPGTPRREHVLTTRRCTQIRR